MSDDQNAVIGLLTNQSRDLSQIKTDLAVNTTKTAAIEDHLKTLNGKVLKQQDELQQLNDATAKNTAFREASELAHDKRKDRMWDILEKALWAIIPGLAIGIWQTIQYLINQGVF
jgi:hypothetical protein